MQTFKISVYYKSNNIIFDCERIYQSEQVERYQISAKGKSIVVQNNRPALRRQNKSNHKFKWILFEGPVTTDLKFLNELFSELERWIRDVDEGGYESRSYQNHPKNK